MRSNGQAPFDTAFSGEPLDHAELLARCMDSLELAERVLNRFEQTFTEDLAQLVEAFKMRDGQRVAGIAHRLKGASANVAAARLTEITSELEQVGRSQSFGEMPGWLDELQCEWNHFQHRQPLRPATAAASD